MLIKETVSAQVSIIDRIGDTASNTFGVRLVLDNPDYKIPAGLKCVVKFLDQFAPEPEVEPEQVYTEPMQAVESDVEQNNIGIEATIKRAQNPDQQLAQAPEQSPKSAERYLVLSGQAEGDQDNSLLISRFQAAGIDDLFEISRGPYKGLISLGLFSSRQTADNFRQKLESLGFNVFIQESL